LTQSTSPESAVAVVTGAGSGIGRAIAASLAEQGYRLVLLDVEVEQARETAGLLRGGTAVFDCDVAEPERVAAAFAAIDEGFGRVDLLVNNAVVPVPRVHPEDLALADWQRTLDVNLTGYFLCAQAAGRRMIAAGRGGAIVNISSINGSSALGRGNLAYSITKGGVNMLTRELAVEWAPHGIRVNAVQPCQTKTTKLTEVLEHPNVETAAVAQDMLRGIPLGRFAEAEEIATAVVFLASSEASMITGALLPVDGGNLALNAGGTVGW
jgi:NAD(P)-dependent dehydrogenase (short-subunit alcohol dehydrogenase family)